MCSGSGWPRHLTPCARREPIRASSTSRPPAAYWQAASPSGEILRSEVATAALATAGSGDVLAGVIGALLAAGLEPFDAAGCGVAVHGAAGLLAEDRIGRAGVVARDIANLLPTAIEHLRGGRGA